MAVSFRSIDEEELLEFYRTMGVAFAFDLEQSDIDRIRQYIVLERMQAAFDKDRIVATFGAFNFHLTVPGAQQVKTAGTTVVTVLPTHRRQGVCRQMMRSHLEEAHSRGELLAALWASESSIYSRFGYGPAADMHKIRLAAQFNELTGETSPSVAPRIIDVDEALESIPKIHDRFMQGRAGVIARDANWWKYRLLADPKSNRGSATAQRIVAVERGGAPCGYALFKMVRDLSVGSCELVVIEAIALDAEAEKSLWHFLLNIDLVTEISCWNRPTDDPLRWWLKRPRRRHPEESDSLWVRLVDVQAALVARRYESSGEVTFDLQDDFCPWNSGTYRLNVNENGVATCEPTSGNGDVAISAWQLSSAYLGSPRIMSMARAGTITGKLEAIETLDRLMRTAQSPWCLEIF